MSGFRLLYFTFHTFQEFVVPRNCRVLDVGAGTGLSGEALRREGFIGKIDALEPSDNMFSLAQAKGIYSHRYNDLIFPDTVSTNNKYAKIYNLGSRKLKNNLRNFKI